MPTKPFDQIVAESQQNRWWGGAFIDADKESPPKPLPKLKPGTPSRPPSKHRPAQDDCEHLFAR